MGRDGRWRARSVACAALAALLAGCGGPDLLYEGRGDLEVEPIDVRLVRVTEAGLVPAGAVRIESDDAGVAFLNDTRGRVVSILFPKTALPSLRCAYTQGFEPDGKATFTAEPLPPGRAATLCVHVKGEIPFEVWGGGDEPLRGTIVIAPPARARAGAEGR